MAAQQQQQQQLQQQQQQGVRWLLLACCLLFSTVRCELDDELEDDELLEAYEQEFVIRSPKHINDLWHESVKQHMKAGQKIDIREGGYTYKLAEQEAHEQLAIRPTKQKRAQANALLAGPTVRYLPSSDGSSKDPGGNNEVLSSADSSQALVMNEL